MTCSARVAAALAVVSLCLAQRTLSVDVEWNDYMRCAACRALASEIEHYSQASRHQQPPFKYEEERVDWTFEKAITDAGQSYAFVVQDESKQDASRGVFVRMSVLRELNQQTPAALESLTILERDPIWTLMTFVQDLAEVFEITLSELVRLDAKLPEIFEAVCQDPTTKLGTICMPDGMPAADE
eukprot:gene4691-7201_t